jgi:hypothetical protein
MPQTTPKITNNLVEIINYTSPESDAKQTKQDLINRENCEIKNIPQAELASKYENWNWIKHSPEDLELYAKYLANSQSLEIYYNHEKAQKEFGDRFWFDIGYGINEKNLLQEKPTEKSFVFPKLGKKYQPEIRGYWLDDRRDVSNTQIKLLTTNQGFNNLDTKYKIIWSYVNSKHFYFSDIPLIWARNNICSIGSNSQSEILFLFTILNSNLIQKIIGINLKTEHEKDLAISLNSVKSYIRIPILNTPQKLELKQKLIQLAQGLLDAETVALQDLVDFDDDRVLPARFGKWEVSNGDTVVASTIILDSTYKFPIKNQPDLIKQTLEKEIGNSEFSLNQLKNLNVFDKNHQTKIKNQIDELVLGMYELSESN